MSKKRYLKSIIIGLMMLFSNILGAQSNNRYSFEKITTEMYQLQQGISQNSIRCVFQDRQGFIWIGTWEGLNRYDGVEFLIFTPNVKQPENGISHQAINTIIQDKKDIIWVGTEGGLNIIEPKTYKITHFESSLNGKVLNDTIRSLMLDNKNNIWIGTQKGLLILDKNRQNAFTLKEFLNLKKPTLEDVEIRCITKDKQDNIWIGTEKGLFYISKEHGLVQSFNTSSSQPFQLTDNKITSISLIGDSSLFVGTENGLNYIDINKVTCKKYFGSNKKDSLNNSVILSLLYENNSVIWVGTSGGGINKFDLKTGKFYPLEIKAFDGNPKSNEVDDKYINSITKDKQGIIWVGTSFTGLIKINERQNLFKTYRLSEHKKQGLNSNNIWCFLNLKNELWIGTENGINIYNSADHAFKYIKAGKNSISSNKIRSIYKDSYGTIWIGTFDGGLNRYYPTTGKVDVYNTFQDEPFKLNSNAIWTIIEDQNSNLWVGTYSGLYKINLKTKQIKSYYNNPLNEFSISSNSIYKLFIDSKKNLWINTYNGLCKYNPVKDNFYCFKHIQGDASSLSTNKLFDIYEDKLGNLWIGTMGGGLNKFDVKTGKVKFFTTENGLPNNVVYSILDDQQGNLWLSTNKGISQFNMFEESFINYTVNDGIQSNEFNLGAQCIDNYGNMYFGGIFGFNVFNPSDIFKNAKPPQIVISSFKSIEQEEFFGINKNDTIELSYSDNVFTIKYAALDFTNPVKNQYKHILQNYDRDWVITNSINSFGNYNRVPPGTYTFQILGSNSDGRWTSEPFSFTIIIRPPWYNTLLFQISAGVGLVLLITYILFLRFRRIRKKHQIQTQLYELERQSLRLQMNPHFIFNTLNSIQSFVLNNNQDESVRYLSKFSKLMRLMLQNSQETLIPLSSEIELLKYYLDLERLRFNNKFNYTIDVESKIDTEFCGIPPALMQPYIENAILHGMQHRKDNDGLIQISFSLLNDNILVCDITDNGFGREYTANLKKTTGSSHNSKGMLITKERLQLINKNVEGQLDIEVIDLKEKNGKASGTKIRIYINIQEL